MKIGFVIQIVQLAQKWEKELETEHNFVYNPKTANDCLKELKEIIDNYSNLPLD